MSKEEMAGGYDGSSEHRAGGGLSPQDAPRAEAHVRGANGRARAAKRGPQRVQREDDPAGLSPGGAVPSLRSILPESGSLAPRDPAAGQAWPCLMVVMCTCTRDDDQGKPQARK